MRIKNPLTSSPAMAIWAGTWLLSSCAAPTPDEHIDVVYDPCEPLELEVRFAREPAQVEAVQDGLDLWNRRLGTRFSLRVDGEPPGDVYRSVPLEFDYAAPAFRGYYDDEIGVVYINDRLQGDDLAITVAHELGHVFGLFHIEKDVRDSVMNRGNLKVPPNLEDADAVASLWGRCSGGPGADD